MLARAPSADEIAGQTAPLGRLVFLRRGRVPAPDSLVAGDSRSNGPAAQRYFSSETRELRLGEDPFG